MPTTVDIETGDGVMKLYDAEPEGPARGAVIVVQEAFGVNDHIEDVTRRFASQGYRSVAPHLFHRTGDPVLDYEDISAVMPHMQAVTESGLRADLDATLGYLSEAGFGPEQVGIVGFCMGGTVVFMAAVHYRLGAAVTYYGGGIASGRFGCPPQTEMAAGLRTPWLGLYGDKDRGIPAEEVEALREAVTKAGPQTEIVRYPDAEHGFHCDARASYHGPSSADAWRRTLEWFKTHIGGGR